MSTNNPTTPETSVMFSLAELADIEEERVREEAAQRAAIAAERAVAERKRLEAERDAEQARIAGEITRREQKERERAEQKARDEARARAEMEIARIEAEGKARLLAENAQRQHELELMRVKQQGGSTRLRRALAAVVGVVVLGGAAAGWAVNGRFGKLEGESQRLRSDRWGQSQAFEEALNTTRTALSKRHDKLKERATGIVTEQARSRAEAARSAIEASGLTTPSLHAYAESLDVLASRVALEEQLAQADKRLADLTKWANTAKKRQLVAKVKPASRAAHRADTDEAAVKAFCKENIAHYKMPAHVRFKDELPMTVTGKPQKFIMSDLMAKELGMTT